jgi:hypothetical protein
MQIPIDLGSETIVSELPEVPITFPVAPGGTLYGFLENFFPENLLAKGELFDAEQCREIRAKHADDWAAWANKSYTWNQFCREVNHLSQSEAETHAALLLARDISAEMRQGGLLGGKSQEAFKRATGLAPKTYLVAWMRIANRYAWLGRALETGIPDPLYDPIPPIRHSGRALVEDIYKQHVDPFLRETFYARGYTNTLEVFAQAVLYAFGYLPSKPPSIGDDLWERAVAGLFDERHVLAMMCAYPGDYFNLVALGEESRRAAFFPTPIEVSTLMGEILLGEKAPQVHRSPEERRAELLQEVSDPCCGTGNLAWPLMNDFIRGEFIDINPVMVAATRALFALYAPWFVQSVFSADALATETAQTMQSQSRQYAVDAALAYAGFQSYHHRKAEALTQSRGFPALSRREQQTEILSSHIQARAHARRIKSQTGKIWALLPLLVHTQNTSSQNVAGADQMEPSETGWPAPGSRKVRPGLPRQLSLFDVESIL